MMGIIFILSSFPSDQLPEFNGVIDIILKKGGHLLGYGLLAIAYLHGLGNNKLSSFLIAGFLALAYGVGDEVHQSFVPGRSPSINDVGIDIAGTTLGLALRWLISKL